MKSIRNKQDLDEESTNSNERLKHNLNLIDRLSPNNINNNKPNEALSRLYSRMNQAHNYAQEEKTVSKRINELKMNIFFNNPSEVKKVIIFPVLY